MISASQKQQVVRIKGSIVALVTPMLETGEVDWKALRQLVEWHIVQGTHALIPVGTTGESATLNVEEHAKVIEIVVQEAAGRVPVIAGTGANATSEAIELTRTAKQLGADAALLVTPYYNKPTQEGLYRHYKAIAEAVDLPQIIYNVPGRTGVDMHNETVLRISQIDGIMGIKDATGDLDRGADLINRCAADFYVYSGDDATAMQLIRMGAKGNISVTANIAPQLMSQLCQAALEGDFEQAARIDARLSSLNSLLFCEANPIPVKWALARMHKIQNTLRLPLTPLDSSYHATLSEALMHAGLI